MKHVGLGLPFVLLLALSGCEKDPKTPEYWENAINDTRTVRERVRVFEDLRSSSALNPSFLDLLHTHLASEKQGDIKAAVVRDLAVLHDKRSVKPLCDAADFGNDSGSQHVNREIAIALGQIGDAEAVPTLVRLLKAKDHYVQVEAMTALGSLRAAEAVEALSAIALDDQADPFLAKRAVQTLGEIGNPKAVPALVKRLFKPHGSGQDLGQDSAFSLYQIGRPSADALLPVLEGKDNAFSGWATQNRIVEPKIYLRSAQVLGDLQDARAANALIARLSYKTNDPGHTLLVRVGAADALGRLRAKEAVKTLALLVSDEDPDARKLFAWALARIGGRDAVPQLTKAAGTGIWDSRQAAADALSLVGDAHEKAVLQKLIADEPARTKADCAAMPAYPECGNPDALAKKHVAQLTGEAKRLDASTECGTDVDCWTKKLSDPEGAVRERAALELGRTGKANAVDALMAKLADPDENVRLGAAQAVDWLSDDSADARKRAVNALPQLDKQLAAERGKSSLARSNEELRRLSAKLHRA